MSVEYGEKPIEITEEESIELVGKFLSKEWKYLSKDQVDIKRIQTGFCNSVYIMGRKDYDSATAQEPEKVVVRKYGGNFGGEKKELKPLSTTQELIVMMEYGRTGLCPKIYGIFDGGRIEEFVDNHQITHAEALIPENATLLAQNLAKFHALRVPFENPGYDFVDSLTEIYTKYRDESKEFFNSILTPDAPQYAMANHDYLADIEWLTPLIREQRHVFMHWDSHYDNVIVLNNPRPDQTRIMLIDFEMGAYNIRGKDLGLWLYCDNFIFNKERKPYNLISEDVIRTFLDAYSKEVESLGFIPDYDRNGRDSYEVLKRESLVGAIVSLLCYIGHMVSHIREFSKVPHIMAMIGGERGMHTSLEYLKDLYKKTYEK